MSPIRPRLAALAAAAVLALPAIWGLATADTATLHRHWGRPPAPLPPAAAWAEDPRAAARGVLDHLTDRIAMVPEATRALGEIRYAWLGDPGSPMLLRAGSLLFNGASTADGRLRQVILRRACLGPDDGGSGTGEAWQTALAENSRALAAALGGPGRRVSFLAVPGKPILYADRLPPSTLPELRSACAEARRAPPLAAWQTALAEAGLIAHYPLRRLEAERDRPHFYPPENFHSEGMAAHFTAWSHLAALFPGAFAPGSVPFRAQPAVSDLRSMVGYDLPITLMTPDYGAAPPYRAHRIEKALGTKLLPEIPHPRWLRVWRNDAPDTRGTAVVFGNSFGLYVPQHFAPAFSRVAVVTNNAVSLDQLARIGPALIAEIAPSEVIFVVNDAYAARFQLGRFRSALAPDDPGAAPRQSR